VVVGFMGLPFGSGSIAPGGRARVTVVLDRSAAAEGRLSGRVRVTSDGGAGTVELTATVGRPPTFDGLVADPPRLGAAGCAPPTPRFSSVGATVTDESGVASARLHWTDASGAAGSTAMAARGGRFSARLGPFAGGGTVTCWVEAVDTMGNRGRSGERTVVVSPCPQ
jgi:hypothetical protein